MKRILSLALFLLPIAAQAQTAASTQQAAVTVPLFTATGKGVQIYTCQQAASGPQWVFQAPEATLTDASGRQIGTHGAGPIWISTDGSSVKGEVIHKTASPDPNAIPLLELKAASVSGNGVMSKVEIIRRDDTHGGIAPTTGCDAQHLNATVRVPYTATYGFYSTKPWAESSNPSGLPNNYQSIFNNDAVQVFHSHYGPHEKVPVHDHPAVATVFVYLNNSGQVRIDHPEPDGTVSSTIRPPTIKGAYRIAPALAERHSVENLSDLPSDFFRVELKHTDLKLPEPYRGKAPQSLDQSLDAIEFTNPVLQVERIICSAPDSAPCMVKPSSSPSLLIALTPFHLTIATSGNTIALGDGSVQWLPPNQAASIARSPASPAHILRIILQ
jgi:Protein of unknown function (DUF3455)